MNRNLDSISGAELANTLKPAYPKISRVQICNVRNPQYGVKLVPGAEKILKETYGTDKPKKTAKLNTIAAVVKTILEATPAARSSDRVLIVEYYKAKGINVGGSFADIMMDSSLPSLESIGRIRRKVQELYPELCADTVVEEGRAENETEYRAFSREEDI